MTTATELLTVTKSELRQILGCQSYQRWKNKVMNDDVIREVLHMDRSAFNQIREFSVPQTRALIEYFKPQFEQYLKR